MLPKTGIIYDFFYNKQFNSKFTYRDFLNLKKDCKKFERLYSKHIGRILKLIQFYSGVKWKQKFIPIQIIEKHNSFYLSTPIFITLCYKIKPEVMLKRLIHELAHINLDSLKWKEGKESNAYVTLIEIYVISNIFRTPLEIKYLGKATKELSKRENIPTGTEWNIIEYLKKLNWDLKKYSLSYYIKKFNNLKV